MHGEPLVHLPVPVISPYEGKIRKDILKETTSRQKLRSNFIRFLVVAKGMSYFLIMIFGGFFGRGTGPMIFYALTFFLGFTMLEVKGTGIIPWLVLTVSSLIIFALNGIVDYELGVVLLAGMAIGSYTGAHIAIKKGDMWIKYVFVIFVVVLGAKLLFF